MSKEEQINKILNIFKNVVEQYPDYDLTTTKGTKAIYHQMIFSNVKKSDKDIDLSAPESASNKRESTFKYWRHAVPNPNLDVFRSPDHMYFCQFISCNIDVTRAKNHIKIYVPLDGEHIEKGTEILFKYISNNKIGHASKVAKRIRFDDIVIRVTTEKDASKIIDFVNSNEYLQEGLIEPNPFAFTKDNIALACDGRMSYNTVVSKLIAKYIMDCKNSNILDEINYQHFYNYLIDNYEKEFIGREPSSFRSMFDLSNYEEKENIKQIIYLVINAQSSNFSYDDFINHYKKSANYFEDIDSLLLEAVETMTDKFNGNYNQTLTNIEGYLKQGKKSFITRNNGLRDKILDSSFRDDLTDILQSKNISLNQYIQTISEKRYSQTKRY